MAARREDDTLGYKLSGPTVKQVQDEVNLVWVELSDPQSDLRAAAKANGLDVNALGKNLKDHLRFRKEGAGVAGVDLLIAVVGSHAAARVGKDLWTYVFLPMLRSKFGDKSIVANKPAEGSLGKKEGSGAKPKSRSKTATRKTSRKR